MMKLGSFFRTVAKQATEILAAVDDRALSMSALAPLPPAIRDDLRRLDALGPGLGAAACRYAANGEGAATLALIRAAMPAHRYPIPHWAASPAETDARRRLIVGTEQIDRALLYRYIDVLDAATRDPWGLPGTDAVPRRVRVYAGEFFAGCKLLADRPPVPKAPMWWCDALGADQMLAIIAGLGGGLVDLFDLVFGDLKGHYYGSSLREQPAFDDLLRRHRSVFAAALVRLPGNQRAGGIAFLAKREAIGDLAFAALLDAAVAAKAGAPESEAAIAAFAGLDADDLAARLRQAFPVAGNDARFAFVKAAIRNGAPAVKAVLQERLPKEKTPRIRAAIEAVVDAAPAADTAGAAPAAPAAPAAVDSAEGYVAVDGRWIAIPPLAVLDATPPSPPPAALREAYDRLIATENARRERAREAAKTTKSTDSAWRHVALPTSNIENLFAVVTVGETTPPGDVHYALSALDLTRDGQSWLRDALARLAPGAALTAVTRFARSPTSILAYSHHCATGIAGEWLRGFLNGAGGDARHLEIAEIASGSNVIEFSYNGGVTAMQPGDGLRRALKSAASHVRTWHSPMADFASDAIWPFLAANLEVFDEAFGLAPSHRCQLSRERALNCLALLPAVPDRYYRTLLVLAVTERSSIAAPAKALLKGAAGLEARLIAMLDDARADVRSRAAEWLGDIRAVTACPALFKRLAKEKSDGVATDLIQTLGRLGADLSAVIGPQTLVAEAEAGLKSGKARGPDWLGAALLPAVRFKDGTPAPRALIEWWVALATRMKDPGATGRFGLYLDQLDPSDAEALSATLLEAWIAHDTHSPSLDEANAHAAANVQARLAQYQRYDPERTKAQVFDELRRGHLAEMPNSASDAKGLLALACRADPARAAQRVRWFLKNHGRRSNQAAALLDMLAGNATPTALQVVIAASVRLKQKSVQKHAGELVARFAEDRGWSVDELADRTVPTAGFDDDGILALACGADARPFTARMDAALGIVICNPQGKTVAALPAGEDEATRDAKKALSTAKKELKQIAQMQTARLYEAMCASRTWPVADWTGFFHDHPVMRRLIERLVWQGLDAEGAALGLFRPTPEGDFTDAGDAAVDITGFAAIRIAHGALVDAATGNAWEAHLKDYRVTPLLAQFGRQRAQLPEGDADKTAVEDRLGWLSDSTTIRSLATKLGYDRVLGDGGGCNEYEKTFPGLGIVAVIEHTGAYAVEELIPASVTRLRFRRLERSGGLKLKDVPPILLTECWSDYHAVAAKGAFDPEWEKKCPW